MKEAYEEKYHELERTHFWFRARRKYILQLLEGSNRQSSILDIGCSSGILLYDLANVGFDVNNLYGIDISPKAVRKCQEAGFQNVFVMDASHIDLKKKFDVAIASDCLEHLENDREALKNWYDLLKPGGKLYVFVPAFMLLWNEHDEANMHFRRYTGKELRAKIAITGFQIEGSGYWNFFLFLPILTRRIWSRLRTSKKRGETGDLNEIPKFNNPLYRLINWENKLLRYLKFPFGISTYCIARKFPTTG
jgi:SAM-dependent methyltransferase